MQKAEWPGGNYARGTRPATERDPQRSATPLAVLMLDGWQVRQRGPGWGKKKTQQPRVEWHEWKTGVFYRHEQSGVLAEKVVIGWQGDPVEFGSRSGKRCGVVWAGRATPWWPVTVRLGFGT